jgi:hypothetical protein
MLLIEIGLFGAVTSAAIAWIFYQSHWSMSAWQSVLFGCVQTFFGLISSFSKILATL